MKIKAIPTGILSANDDSAAAARRKKLREDLLNGKELKITPQGEIKSKGDMENSEGSIVVPEGKLAHQLINYNL